MNKVSDYRHHAQECRVLARNAPNEEQRTQLLKMAEAWEAFAAEHERMVRTKEAKQNTANG